MTAAAPAARAPAPAARSTYSSVAITLHWLIAALVLTNIGLAWYFNTLKGPAQIAPLALHKSIGITVLLLSVLRVVWRFVNPPPPWPASVPTWERWAATTVHAIFYVLILGLPLSGWAMVSASPLIKVHPTVLYGLVPWPAFPLPGLSSDQLHDARLLFKAIHIDLGWIAYATIALHVAAALKHQFFDRDDVVALMMPFLPRKADAP